MRVRTIGRKAILGWGTDTDLMVDGGNDLYRVATKVSRELGARFGVCQTMCGPYSTGGAEVVRYRVVSRCEKLDIIIVCPEEYDYVAACYDKAKEQAELYSRIRETEGKDKAYQRFGLNLFPRNWKAL